MDGRDLKAPRERLPALIESLLFVSDGPVTIGALSEALGATMRAVTSAIGELETACGSRGIRLQRSGDSVQLITDPAAGPFVERFLGEGHHRLSGAALETLAIIAYRQPVTRATIEAIRGVSCERSLATLRARDLIEEIGRAEGIGRPTLWGTTIRFLEHFGLERSEDLPAVEDIAVDEVGATEERAS
jgi:segregation and condensation protein B